MASSAMPGGAMDGAAQDGNGGAMSGAAEGTMSGGMEGAADGGTEGTAAGRVAKPTNKAWIDGMDRTTTYLLKIRLPGNPKKARKNVGCFLYEEEVDSDKTNLKGLIKLVVDQFPPRYLEVPHVQYYDGVSKTFPEIRTDQELMLMFEKQKKTKVVDMFIVYIDPSDPYQPISEWHFEPEVITQQDEDNYLQNPIPENEHVGIDEEVIYLTNELVADINPVVMYEKGSGTDEDEDEDEGEGEDDDEDETEIEEEEEDKIQEPDNLPQTIYDVEDPPMTVGTTYPSMAEFKLALSQHAIKHEFEYNIEKSAPYRFRGYCSRKVKDDCPWRIHASTMEDKCTVMVKINPSEHECCSTRRKKNHKNATKFWICSKVKDWLIEDETLNAKVLQGKLKEKYKVNIHYKRVYMGKELALKQLYGDWDCSFDNLYRFKAEIENSCPGSVVHIEHHTINKKIRFKRVLFALKPCIDGFLNGCRPYLAIDSTFLTGKFKGQLASASAIDGHNWLYPVCFGVFDSETNDNWEWFMKMLREVIGSPKGLAICTDAGQPVMHGVHEVFPEAEHRECMFHLVSNFKKKFTGKVFDDHLWAAAYSWNPYIFEKHWRAMDEAKPAATAYLRKSHNKLWTRSQFSTICKVDYVTNNLAECFNNWIKHHKSLNLDDLLDKLRQLLMSKWNQRRKISRQLDGLVLPHILKKMKEMSRDLNLEVLPCSDEVGEVTALGGSGFRFVVKLNARTCTCRQWQVCGIPCKHAIAFITSLSNAPLENYVDLHYSVDKFRAAYCYLIPAIPDKSQWPKSSHGFFMHPPLLKATAGRRKNERHKGCTEKKRKKGQHKCPICTDYGHHWHNCKRGNPEDIATMMAERGPPKKKKKRTTKQASESSIVPVQDEAPASSTMSFPPSKCSEPSTNKKGSKQQTSGSQGSVRCRSRSGSNQPEAVSHVSSEQQHAPAAARTKAKAPVKVKGKRKKKDLAKEISKLPMMSLDSPAMGTRSKKQDAASPAMNTRRRRLSL